MAVIFDYIRAAAMIFGFSITWFQDRKYWFLAHQTYLTLFTGVFFVSQLFPHSNLFSLKHPTAAQIDGATAHFGRCIAGMFLGQMWFSYQSRRSRDETVIGARLLSLSTVGLFMLFMSLYGYLTYKNIFFDNFLWFDMLGHALVLVSTVVQIVKTRPVMGRRETKGVVATLLRINLFFTFVLAIACMAFPIMMLSPLDRKATDMNICQSRWSGAVMLGWVILNRYALSFRHDEDRKLFCEGQLVTAALYIFSTIYAFFVHDAFTYKEMVWEHVGLLPFLIPLTVYYLLRRQEKEASSSTHYYTRSRTN